MPSPAQRRAAARKYGPQVDSIARQYTNPITGRPLSGAALLLKLDIGEGVGTSSAGAKGETQFMPGTREVVLDKTGGRVDPWRSLDEAYAAAALHLTGKLGNRKGLEGYNPGGGQGYVNYILGQRVGKVGGSRPGAAPVPAAAPVEAAEGSGQGLGLLAPQSESSAAALIAAMRQPQARPQTAGIASPAFAARAPSAGPSISSGGGPAPKPDVSALLDAVRTAGLPAQMPATGDPGPSGGTSAAQVGTKPGTGTDQLRAVFEEADRVDRARVPYKWGGGHGARQPRGSKVTPLDCSGAVSRVLGIDPRVSGQFEKFGTAGRSPSGKGVTVYANDEHVLMEINGRFWGTSKSNPGGGPGWIPRSQVSKDYLSRFTARHLARVER